jgi:pyrophosphate--fructose-6-phosphate 1-phosphotransferase
MLLVHEVMGRNCGWLTAYTAKVYRERLSSLAFVAGFNFPRSHLDVDAVYLPEMELDIAAEAKRLQAKMDEKDCVSIFVSEGASVEQIVAELLSRGENVEKDAFGHVKLDKVNVGNWFSKQFGKLIGAEKTLVQKSGYFARAAAPGQDDLRLIKGMVDLAVDSGLRGEPGVVGHDEGRGGILRAIEFARIKGGKPFDIEQPWFGELLGSIGQPRGKKVTVKHGGQG